VEEVVEEEAEVNIIRISTATAGEEEDVEEEDLVTLSNQTPEAPAVKQAVDLSKI